MSIVTKAILVFLVSFVCLGTAISDNVNIQFFYANPRVENPMVFANGKICLTLQTGPNTWKSVLAQTDANGVAVVDAGNNNKSVTIAGMIGCTEWAPYGVYYICYNSGMLPTAGNNSTIVIPRCNKGTGPNCPLLECPN